MSDIVEKTLSSIPKFFSENLLGSAVSGPPSPRKFASRGFQNFIRQINKVQSFSEQDQYAKQELSQISQKMAQPDITHVHMCDLLCRVIYCSMLGYDAAFAYIHVAKLAHQGSGFEKRMGYVAACLLLHEDHELILLLMNTIQKDLQSTNLLNNCTSLTAICNLVNSDMITTVLPFVQQKLRHQREIVRAKAVQCLHSFVTRVPSLIPHLEDHLKQTLYDKDPSVMAASVNMYHDLIMKNPDHYSDLLGPMKDILQQIICRSLPSSFEYHGIPLPWLQIKLLRILAVLCNRNEKNSREIYTIVAELLQKINMKEKMAFAIMYECIQLITAIHPHPPLLEEAAVRVKKFVSSSSYLLKYLGVKSLTSLIQASPKSAMDCQLIVVDLLEDPDPAIQRKTINLLYGMANPSNAQVVCNKLLEHLQKSQSISQTQDLVQKVLTLAHKFAKTGQWYFDAILTLLHSARNNVPANVVNQAILKIKDGLVHTKGSNSTSARGYHQHLVKKSVEILFDENCSQDLIRLCVWVLGEFAMYLKNMPEDKILHLLHTKYVQQGVDAETKIWIINTVLKLTDSKVVKFETLNKVFACTAESEGEFFIRKKLQEVLQYSERGQHGENLWCRQKLEEMDFSLSFMDEYVLASLDRGCPPYLHYNQRHKPLPQLKDNSELFAGLAEDSVDTTESTGPSGERSVGMDSSDSVSDRSSTQREQGLNLKGVKRVWGRDGIIRDAVEEGLDDNMGRGFSKDNPKMEHLTRKKELAAALFSGITDSEDREREEATQPVDPFLMEEDPENTSFKLNVTQSKDSGGWRQLHSTKISENDPPLSDFVDVSGLPQSEASETSPADTDATHNFSEGQGHVKQVDLLLSTSPTMEQSMGTLEQNIGAIDSDFSNLDLIGGEKLDSAIDSHGDSDTFGNTDERVSMGRETEKKSSLYDEYVDSVSD